MRFTLGIDVGGTFTDFVNYDRETGAKHQTEVGDGASLGSDTMIVAPRAIGRDAATGAGAVVTHDVPDGMLAVGAPARVVRPVQKAPARGT